jgi:putative phosphoribosyl transferase
MKPLYRDRLEAGRILATHLQAYASQSEVIVLGLPRGGVPVAYEVALALRVPLDVFLVRKLGVPGQEELAMGAIAMGGVCILSQSLVREFNIARDEIDATIAREQAELERREREYRDGRPLPHLTGKTVILVDDGLATGASMWAAVTALRQFKPRLIVIAVPVAARETCAMFVNEVDEIVCPATPEPFHAVGLWYETFAQTTDEEVHQLLKQATSPLVS